MFNFHNSKIKLLFQITADPQYQIVKTADLHSSAEEFSVVELVMQTEKPQLPSENDVKIFDVVVDCSDHHFVKECGHENVILYT